MAVSASQATPLLSVSDLRIAFGAHEAVRGVSFEIAAGETLGLVGESGSGKSATSLALMGLLPSNAKVNGNIMLTTDGDGPSGQKQIPSLRYGMTISGMHDLLDLPEDVMRQHRGSEIAMIFQEPMTALNRVMKVGRQIAEAIEAHHPKLSRGEVRERVLEAMHEVALPEPERRMNDYPHQFSGGQRQRVMIAMALINKPKLLIADEPTTALDVTVQAQILALLKRLQQEHGLGMLFISHDLAVVAQVADRVAVMQHGLIVEHGVSEAIFRNPQHAYTRRLLRSAPTMTTARGRPLAQ